MIKAFKFSITVIFLAVIMSMIYFLYIVYVYETSFDKVVSKESQDSIFKEFKKTENLPTNFYKTLEKYYPEYFDTKVWESLI